MMLRPLFGFLAAGTAALALSACPAEPASTSLPPAGLAGGVPVKAPAQPSAPPAPATVRSQAQLPPGHPPVGAGPGAVVLPGERAPAGQPGALLVGSVVEAHHVAEYSYLKVKTASGEEQWAAILKNEAIGTGDHVELREEVWMSNFQSPSLKRSFDRILFGQLAAHKAS